MEKQKAKPVSAFSDYGCSVNTYDLFHIYKSYCQRFVLLFGALLQGNGQDNLGSLKVVDVLKAQVQRLRKEHFRG